MELYLSRDARIRCVRAWSRPGCVCACFSKVLLIKNLGRPAWCAVNSDPTTHRPSDLHIGAPTQNLNVYVGPTSHPHPREAAVLADQRRRQIAAAAGSGRHRRKWGCTDQRIGSSLVPKANFKQKAWC